MEHNIKIIDFHMHPYIDRESNFCIYKQCFSDPVDMKSDFLRAGIEHICGSVIANGNDFHTIRKCNRDALTLKKQLGDFYTPGIHVHPGYVRQSCEEIELMRQNGVRLVGELVPYMNGWEDYSSAAFSEILQVCQGYGMIVSFHSMGNEQMDKMVKNHPCITFVAAHPGEKDAYLKHIGRMKKYDNYYLDISGTGLFRYGMLKYGVEQVGFERFLFGSDYPICNPAMQLAGVLYEQISDDAKEHILRKNAQRLLK